MSNTPRLYRNKTIRERVRQNLIKRHYDAGENWGHTDGRLFAISRVVFFISAAYTILLSLTYIMAYGISLSEPDLTAHVVSAYQFSLLVMSLSAAALIAGFVLIILKRFWIGGLCAFASVIPSTLLFHSMVDASASSGLHILIDDSTTGAMTLLTLAGIALIVLGVLTQYGRRPHFMAGLCCGALLIGFTVWQIAAPFDYFGGGFRVIHLVLIFLLGALLLLCGYLSFTGKALPAAVLYLSAAVPPLILLVMAVYQPIRMDGFGNFYLRHGLSALLLSISSIGLFLTALLEHFRIRRELDAIGEELYKTAPDDRLVSPEDWDRMVMDYIAKLEQERK